MTRLSKSRWTDIVEVVEILEAAGISKEDAQELTSDNELLKELAQDLRQRRLGRKSPSSPVMTSDAPITLEQAFFPKGRAAYSPSVKGVRARSMQALSYALKGKVRDTDDVYVADLSRLSREGTKHLRNIGEMTLALTEEIMREHDVAFADPGDPEMIPTRVSVIAPNLYFGRGEILDMEIRQILTLLGAYVEETNTKETTLGQYLRLEIGSRDEFVDKYTQQIIDEFVDQHDII